MRLFFSNTQRPLRGCGVCAEERIFQLTSTILKRQ